MARRWLLPVATLGLAFGSMVMAASAASASTASHHATIHSTTVRAYRPGGVMIRPGGVARAIGHGANATATSTNWSGYAVTGANGTYKSVSANWTEPTATCTSSRSDLYASFWVGLDGYSSNSVEQTGTDSDCVRRLSSLLRLVRDVPGQSGELQQPGATGRLDERIGHVLRNRHLHPGAEGQHPGLDSDHHQDPVWPGPLLGRGHHRGPVLKLRRSPAGQLRHTISYSTLGANGSSLGSQSPIAITMINNSGADKDSTSSISSGGAFSNTWIKVKLDTLESLASGEGPNSCSLYFFSPPALRAFGEEASSAQRRLDPGEAPGEAHQNAAGFAVGHGLVVDAVGAPAQEQEDLRRLAGRQAAAAAVADQRGSLTVHREEVAEERALS